MVVGVYDIEARQGGRLYRHFTWKDDNGDPIDLTGYMGRMEVRETAESDTILLYLSTETETKDGDIVLGDAAGTVEIEVLATVMEGVSFRNGVYDIELYTDADHVERMLRGKFTVYKEVTRG